MTSIKTATVTSQAAPPGPTQERTEALREAGFAPCVQAVLAFDGRVCTRDLRQAIEQAIARHEILRGGGADTLKWTTSALSAVPERARREVRDRQMRDERRALPPSTEEGAWVRAHLLSWSANSYDLVLTLDARGADAGTIGPLCAEIMAAYAGEPLLDDPLPHADVVAWQAALAQEEDAERGRLYWELHGRWPGTDRSLPFEEAGRADMKGARSSEVLGLEPGDAWWTAASRAASDAGCSLPAFLLGCWQALFWRLNGFVPVTGVTLSARKYPELADVIGPLDRTAPLASRARNDMTVAGFVRAVDRAWQGAIEWLEHYDWRRDGVSPDHVYGLGFTHIEWPTGWTHREAHATLAAPNVDVTGAKLALTFCEAGGRRFLSFQFDPHAFTRATVRHLSAVWTVLVGHAARQLNATLDSLSLATDAERARVLTTWNATDRICAEPADTVVSWLEVQAARSPDVPAVGAEDATWTYGELHDHANRIAQRLRKLGVARETRVAVWMSRSLLNVAALIGVWKAGGAFVPLDPSHPPARLAFQIEDAGARIVLTDRECAADVPAVSCTVEVLDRVDAAWRDEAPQAPSEPIWANQLAYVIYTSGSTGTPKGVEVTHGMLRNLVGCYVRVSGTDSTARTVHLGPQAFDVIMLELWPSLVSGGQLWLLPPGVLGDATKLWGWFVARGITHVCTVPAMAAALFREPIPADTALRWMNIGGDRLARGLDRPMPFEVTNLYGPTETTVIVTGHAVDVAAPEDPPPPIGRPLDNTRTYVLDAAGQPVPVGHVGEIFIGGAQVARGYSRRPDVTAERFVPDPFGTPGGRLYRTGDLGRYRTDGALEYVGRRDQQIKLRGYRIELGEIEAAVRQLSGVREAVVVLREDTPDNRRLVAYIVRQEERDRRKEEERTELEAFQQQLRARLPEYMVPAVIVVLDAFPLTSNGKIDRRRLPAPDSERTLARTFVAPRTPAEEIIAGVWAEVLRMNRVGVHDNFLAIGGDSLNAVQVLVRLREAFGREIPLRTLLERTTLEALAAELLRTEGDTLDEPALERVNREAALPVSFGQERLWVVDRVTGSQAYHVPVVAQLIGAVHPDALADAVDALAARHEVLRTTIGMRDGRPVQEIAPPADVPVPWIDLSALRSGQRARATETVVRALESSPFDLRIGPLWRVTVVRLDANTHLFTCILHHIVADGWSMGVLLRDLAALYEGARTGQQAKLPELKVQYADYAAWQRGALAAGRQAKELAYWRTQLADVTTLALPTDRPRGPVQSVQGGAVSDRWDAALSRDVLAWARAQGATPFMVLLAAWQAVLARHAGQSDVAVGVPVAQRPRPELEPLIGFFLNTLVMRAHVPGTTTWRALVADVRARALGAFAHQTVPFERIIEELQPQRDLTRTPFFQVLFVLQNNPHGDVALEGLTLSPLPQREYASKYDLTLHVTPNDEAMQCTLQYDASLFDRSTIERLLQHFKTFIRAALDAPDAPLASLSLVGEAERSRIHAADRFPRQASTNADWTIEQSIVDRFQEQVARRPSRLALRTRQTAWTYRELNRRANRVARAIVDAAPGTNGRVALLCRHDETMVAAVLGVLKAGHSYVPLDPGAPIVRLRQVWTDAEPIAIVTTDTDVATARELADGRPVIVANQLEDAAPRHAPAAKIPAAGPAYILYTSGSTGLPKGVVQNHRNVLHHIRAYASNLHLGPADKLTLLSGYGFDASVMDIFGALLSGAALYPIDMRDTTPIELADWIDRGRITVLHSTPTVFRMLMGSLEARRTLASVRLVVLGGEAAYRTDVDLFRQHFSRDCAFVNGLGPTESTVTLQQFVTHDTPVTRYALPVGYPVDSTVVRLIDEEGRNAEVFGEIEIESPHVAVGYWRRDELTRSKFADVEAGVRRYRTGDLGRLLPDGSLEFLGRKDHQVKVRGHRVELGEIETVLAEHDAIRECVVASRPDPAGENRLVAYVVPRTAEMPPSRVLRQFVRSRLPDYMVPAAVMWLESLPFRANGKVDRDALPPPQFDVPAARVYVAPRDPYEQRLSDLWSDVLGLDRVGVEDNFFELGGDSIKAIQVSARARTHGVPVTPRLLFQHQTIAELALAVATAGDPNEPGAVDEPSGGGLEMTADQMAELSSRVEFEIS